MSKKNNVGRKCSICSHNKAQEINRRIVRGDSFRGISLSYGMADMSVARHTENCLQLDIKALVEEKRIEQAINVHQELAEQLKFAKDLRTAAREYLSDPQTGEITLIPRSDEVSIVYEDYKDTTPTGAPKKKTDDLDFLLERAKNGGIEPIKTIIKHVDLRSFALDAIRVSDLVIDKFGKIQGVYAKDNIQKNPSPNINITIAKQQLIDGIRKLDVDSAMIPELYDRAVDVFIDARQRMGETVNKEDLKAESWELIG